MPSSAFARNSIAQIDGVKFSFNIGKPIDAELISAMGNSSFFNEYARKLHHYWRRMRLVASEAKASAGIFWSGLNFLGLI